MSTLPWKKLGGGKKNKTNEFRYINRFHRRIIKKEFLLPLHSSLIKSSFILCFFNKRLDGGINYPLRKTVLKKKQK